MTDQTSPYDPPPQRGRRTLAGAALLAVIAATVAVTVLVTGGGDAPDSAGPSNGLPTRAAETRFGIPPPPSAAQPGVLVLPPPTGPVVNGVPLGFPRTTAGAVSAIVRWTSLAVPVDEERQVAVLETIGSDTYIATSIPRIRAEYDAAGDRPPGYWMVVTPIGHKVLSADDDAVDVVLLTLTQWGDASGSAQSAMVADTYSLRWTDGDWKLETTSDSSGGLGAPASRSVDDLRAAGWEVHQLG